MHIIVIISSVVIVGGLFLLRFIQIRQERKEKKMFLEQRLEHLIHANKKEAPIEKTSHPFK
ncbi:hypothetical protein [Lysinibacillus sp. FJAT-14222]|uniref:hypothetical protein n=1 Tax=Lysinibacillus sp. FJAT-14222 TaxID=1932366 RepID=UPI0006ADCC9B|nr:hypothetical protein [Lysinibacillus sp. FJAT-14222]KOS63956.1 hypothetical protein AN161_05025 [Lysinibacillus sp. FJAT-14222]